MCDFSKLNPTKRGATFPTVIPGVTATVPDTVGPDQPGPPSTAIGQPESVGAEPPSSPEDPDPDEVPDDPDDAPEDDPVPDDDVDEVPDDAPPLEPVDDEPDPPDEPDDAPEEPPEAPPEDPSPLLEPGVDPGGSDAVVPHAASRADSAKGVERIAAIRERACMGHWSGAPFAFARLKEIDDPAEDVPGTSSVQDRFDPSVRVQGFRRDSGFSARGRRIRMNTNTVNNDLHQHVTIVTGASRGLGRGIAAALAAKGARVVGIARSKGDLVTITGDAADEALAARVVREERPTRVVVCAGAAPVLNAFHEQTWEDFSTNWQVDTKSAFVWLKAILRDPLPQGSHVIVVSSGAALQGSPLSGGYAGAKRMQWLLADYAATEAKRAGLDLRVHALLPHLNPSTELGRAAIAGYAARAGVSSVEEFQKRYLPYLTPEIMGAAVVDLFTRPADHAELAYRVTGKGLVSLTEKPNG
jgi:NAD(P)-dependent dehydrogenase (short-subunit alcohol dehydrogenase family)